MAISTRGDRVRIMIVDVDNCLLSSSVMDATGKVVPNTRKDLLSQKLIDLALTYDAYYICTHRCSELTFAATLDPKRLEFYIKDHPELDPTNIFLINIIENFSNATGLKCLAVSTPDDFNASACGQGYLESVAPYEKLLLQLNQERLNNRDYKKCEDLSIGDSRELITGIGWDKEDKNLQILQVINDARKKFPGKKLDLDFYDDQIPILENTKFIPRLDIANAVLNLIHHSDVAGVSQPKGRRVGSERMETTVVKSMLLNNKPAATVEQATVFLGVAEEDRIAVRIQSLLKF